MARRMGKVGGHGDKKRGSDEHDRTKWAYMPNLSGPSIPPTNTKLKPNFLTIEYSHIDELGVERWVVAMTTGVNGSPAR